MGMVDGPGVGTLLVRVLFERAILSFRSYDRLDEISSLLKRLELEKEQ